MKIKTILLAFGALFFIGMGMLVADTWAEIHDVYEVTMPAEMASQLPGEFSKEAFLIMVEMGWLRPEVTQQSDIQYGIVEGQSCHLVVWWNGNDCWVDCILGRGSVRCPCWYSPDPNVN